MRRDADSGSVARPKGQSDSTRSRPLAAASRPSACLPWQPHCRSATLGIRDATFLMELSLRDKARARRSMAGHGIRVFLCRFVTGDTSEWRPNLFRSTTAIYPHADFARQARGIMRMRVVVDLNKCLGYAQCVFLAPAVFKL